MPSAGEPELSEPADRPPSPDDRHDVFRNIRHSQKRAGDPPKQDGAVSQQHQPGPDARNTLLPAPHRRTQRKNNTDQTFGNLTFTSRPNVRPSTPQAFSTSFCLVWFEITSSRNHPGANSLDRLARSARPICNASPHRPI